MEPKFLTIEEIAEQLRISYAMVYALLREGKLRGYQIRSAWRVTQVQVDDYLHKVETGTETISDAAN
jgi:excisionase family DNA binding protein